MKLVCNYCNQENDTMIDNGNKKMCGTFECMERMEDRISKAIVPLWEIKDDGLKVVCKEHIETLLEEIRNLQSKIKKLENGEFDE